MCDVLCCKINDRFIRKASALRELIDLNKLF